MPPAQHDALNSEDTPEPSSEPAKVQQISDNWPAQEEDHPADEEAVELPNPYPRTRRFARYFYDRFVRVQGSPERIAWGAAVGFFVAMSPTMGIQTLIAVPIAALFRISKVAAAATVWLSNPFTAPVLYGFTYAVGAKFLGYPLKAPFFSNPSWETLWHSSKGVFLSLVVGGAVTGIVVAVIGYFLTLGMVKTAREKARKLKMKRKKKR
jgi:uncharacterized protein (DUF2062 family)